MKEQYFSRGLDNNSVCQIVDLKPYLETKENIWTR